MSYGGFWDVNFGNMLTMFVLLLAFWGAHIGNVRRIKASAAEIQEIKTKLDLIYMWFCNNVVGRGEPPRHHGGAAQLPDIEISGAESGDS